MYYAECQLQWTQGYAGTEVLRRLIAGRWFLVGLQDTEKPGSVASPYSIGSKVAWTYCKSTQLRPEVQFRAPSVTTGETSGAAYPQVSLLLILPPSCMPRYILHPTMHSEFDLFKCENLYYTKDVTPQLVRVDCYRALCQTKHLKTLFSHLQLFLK